MENQNQVPEGIESIFMDMYYKSQLRYCTEGIPKDTRVEMTDLDRYMNCFNNFDHIFDHFHVRIKNLPQKHMK